MMPSAGQQLIPVSVPESFKVITMFRPVSLYIGLRYTRAKRRSHFVSFISLVSMLGIALGVTVLITVLSVMNGFDYQIRHRIFDLAEQVTIGSFAGTLKDWPTLNQQVLKYKGVVATAPFINGQGMLTNSGQSFPIVVKGVDPKLEVNVSKLPTKMVSGSFSQLKPGDFGIIMGEDMANSLGIGLGDKILLLTPQASVTPVGIIPRYKRFTVAGLFKVGGGFGFDTGIAYVNLQDAQKLYNLGDAVSGLRIKVTDLYAAPRVAAELQTGLQGQYLVGDWTEQFGAFFKAIRMEKTMMFFILVLIVAVAAFNLVSSLVMIVNDKRPEIAILRTLGASPRDIMTIFMVQGCLVGLIGTALGLIGGILLATHATEIVAWIQQVFNVQFISSSVYLVDFLPSKLELTDIVHICIIALLLSLVATLYPAWQAARTQPAEALRYE